VDVTHTQVTFTGNVVDEALSPDGRTVAYAVGVQSERVRILVRDLAGGQALEIWHGLDVLSLHWMPDGARLLVAGVSDQGQSQIWLVPRLGGPPRRVAALNAPLVAVSPDGSQLAGAFQDSRGFRVVPTSGGESRRVELADMRFVHDLTWDPDGDRVAVVGRDDDGTSAVWTATLDGQQPRRVYGGNDESLSVCWSAVGDVLYLQRHRNETTELVRMAVVGTEPTSEVLLSGLPASRPCEVSADGQRLLHARTVGYANLWRVDLEQSRATLTALTQGTSTFAYPHVSPDGQSVSATVGAGSPYEIVMIPLAGGDPIPLSSGANASWSPDGRQLAFTSARNGSYEVFVGDADGQQATLIEDTAVTNRRVTWFPDGRLAWQTSDARNYRIRDLATEQEETLVADPSVGFVFAPHVSPSGDQVAVYWNRLERGLWVVSWPARAERFLAPDLQPAGWSADGQWIYAHHFNAGSELVRVAVRTGTVETVARFPPGRLLSCNLTPDARALVCSLLESKSDAWLVEHFDPQLPPSVR
jgi:Tol biopolymer transport system component